MATGIGDVFEAKTTGTMHGFGEDQPVAERAPACIHELLEAQVERTPEAVAVVCRGGALSYRQLNDRANRLARHLRELGVGPDVLVALCVERSLDMVVGLLAIIKAGGAYVPLDPKYPRERLAYMLEDSAPRVVLVHDATQALMRDLSRGSRLVNLQSNAADWRDRPGSNLPARSAGLTPQNLAYVIYTSGSTGTPKGVMIEHRNLVNLAAWQRSALPVEAGARILQFASVSFDACIWELLLALWQGGALHLPEAGPVLAGETLGEFIARSGITHATLPPAVLAGIPREQSLGSLDTLIVAGEALNGSLVRRWMAAGRRFINAYGPTEATVCATARECTTADHATPSIGRPLSNTRIYILDARGAPVAVGAVGEIFIAGAGVARGYLNRPQLTAERFSKDPFGTDESARMYRSGDLGRWRADGDIEYLGRNDFQVKVRGFRIELGEIEARLRACPGVREAVVLAREESGQDKRLVAYYQPAEDLERDALTWSATLRAHLRACLPEYMVPAAYVYMAHLPLTPNGKLDRKGFPAPAPDAYASGSYEEPRGPIERQLAQVWAEILKVGRVGRHDNFFELGGNSLQAVEVAARFREVHGTRMALRNLFDHPTIAECTAAVAGPDLSPRDDEEIAWGARPTVIPLAHCQRRVWFLGKMAPSSTAYNAQVAIYLEGALEVATLEFALNDLVRRHEVFRTTFEEIDGELLQRIHAHTPGSIRVHDLGAADAETQALRLGQLTRMTAQHRFDPQTLPLVRWDLVRLSDQRHVFLYVEHHLVHDGYSFNLLLSELTDTYNGIASGRHGALKPIPEFQYADFAVWEERWMRTSAAARQLAFWKKTLHDCPAYIELPFRQDLDPARRESTAVRFPLPIELSRRLRTFSAARGLTLYVTMLTAFVILLRRYSGQSDIPVGTGIANRRHPRSANVPGMFVNLVVLRSDASGEPTVAELLERVRKVVGDAAENQEFPFERIVEALNPARRLGSNPFFQNLFSFHDSRFSGAGMQGLKAVIQEGLSTGEAKFDLNVIVIPRDDSRRAIDGDADPAGIHVSWEYKRSLFTPTTIETMIRHFQQVLGAMIDDANQSIERIALLDARERRQVLHGWNATRTALANRCVHSLFEAQARRTPAATAVVHDGQALSYAALDARANQLAHLLRSEGVEPLDRVAILLERSLELVIAELAILKCGAAYVPLETTAPTGRLSFMLEDCAAKVLLRRRGLAPDLQARSSTIDVDDPRLQAEAAAGLNLPGDPESPAYVMYTSGSSGEPKGVVVPHRAIERLVVNNGFADFRADDRVAFAANPAFDASTLEVWAPLLNGGCIVVIEQADVLDPEAFKRQLLGHRVNVLWLTAGLLRQYAGPLADIFGQLRYLFAGGDVLDPAVIDGILHGQAPQNLLNCYGPTESTTFASTYRVREVAPGATQIPIGRPIANTFLYILDAHQEPVPVGVPGEIHIGGVGVACGYLNRPRLTEQRFIPDPFSPDTGARMYRSGDLGRWREDGNIEYLGRNDFQVKVRGFRIELGEIEARLREHASVRDAVVLAREDVPGQKRLVAYIIPATAALLDAAAALRAHLAVSLPDYMVPAAYVQLPSLPLTANGKCDRRALPAPEAQAYARREYEEPRGDAERQVAEVWAEVLSAGRIGRQDDFFALGGHSLLAVKVISRVRERLHVEVALNEIFARPQLAGFAAGLPAATAGQLPRILPAARGGDVAPSFAQRRLWFLAQIEGAGEAYHISRAWHLSGTLDENALRRALAGLKARHESLRTTFSSRDGEPRQCIAAQESAFDLREHDLRGDRDAQSALRRLIAEESAAPFDLQAGPLIRGRLIRLDTHSQVVLITLHHIISDGWSMGVLTRELGTLYDAFRQNLSDPLPALPIQYPDYALWQQRWMGGERLRQQTEYWRRTLSGAPTLLELPTDRRRPARQDYAGGRVPLDLDEELTARLKAFSLHHSVTLFMTLLAGWAAVLGRLTGQDDVVIGVAGANRGRAEVEPLIGFFVNSMAVRLDLSEHPTVARFVAHVKSRALEAHQNQDLPFEQVVELVHPPRTLAHTPIFQVMFQWQNTDASTLELPGIGVTPLPGAEAASKFDLTLNLGESGGQIAGGLEYATALFDRGTVEAHAGYLRAALTAMLGSETGRIDALALLGETERHRLTRWNDTATDYPHEGSVPALIEAQAARTPAAIAVVYEDTHLTYAELNAQANRLANVLLARIDGHRASPPRIGVIIDRSLEMLIALLAVMKAGCAYIPLDPAYPRARIDAILEEAEVALVIVDGAATGDADAAGKGDWGIPESAVVDFRRDAAAIAAASAAPCSAFRGSELACVIYTSGSSGTPKGVEVPHRSLVNLLCAMTSRPGIAPTDVLLAVTTISFDISGLELFLPLTVGARVVIAARAAVADGFRLRDQIDAVGATVLQATPATWRLLLEAGFEARPGFKMLCGGEALPHDLAQRLLQGPGELWNLYGPTETTIWSACARVGRGMDPITVGGPIANTQFYILDAHDRLLPTGARGQLHIGGDGVTRGYLKCTLLTADKFLQNPFAPGRIYRTGDLARWTSTGAVQILGRIDDQIKLHGYRIEPGEIEARLRRHPSIAEAVVVARADADAGGGHLVAYFTEVGGAQAADADSLRQHLRAALPDYMIPAIYVRLLMLPRTANGKLDRAALPAGDGFASISKDYEAPVGEIETRVARIWAELLKVDRVGRTDDFFELGGHSLAAVRLMARIADGFGMQIGVAALFTAPTLRAFSARVAQVGQAREPWHIVNIQPLGTKTPIIAINNTLMYYQVARELGTDRPFLSVQLFDPDHPEVLASRSMEEITADYVSLIREAQPRGPYVLIGLCVAGLIAYEAGIQLRKAGEEVALIVMADTLRPGHSVRLSFPKRLWTELRRRFVYRMHTLALLRRGTIGVEEFISTTRAVNWPRFKRLRAALRRVDERSGEAPEHMKDSWFLPALIEARSRYRAAESSEKLLLLQSDMIPPSRLADPKMGWADVAKGPILNHRIRGWHHHMFHDKDGARKIARHLAALLDPIDRGS